MTANTQVRYTLFGAAALAALVALSAPCCLFADEDVPPGKSIYSAKCADCHGKDGEGTEEYSSQLAGDLSVAQLAEVIRETMPSDDPGTLSAEEATDVAAFVHDTFYSAIARDRNRPARIELARLTVAQYHQVVADLMGSFRTPMKDTAEQGLKADYYRGRRIGNSKELAKSRTDARVEFDFGTAGPVPEAKDPHSFSIRWQGAVLAPETGEYEFIVRTEHAVRLWVNDLDQALIDAWVKSGDDTEYRANLFLVAGRPYPLRLEFSKAKQGVDDSKKNKNPPATKASIALLWKHPRGVLETIPARFLTPEPAPETFVCTTPFPPDDRSYGWERGTSVSKQWDQATTGAAIEAAGYVVKRLRDLSGARTGDNDRTKKLRTFCSTLAERAFRRPLTDQQKELFIDRQFELAKDDESAVKRVVILLLKSPRFLYREVGGGPDQFDVAARLSFGLWDSIPDKQLWQAASEGRLATKEQIAEQAERMLADFRARAKLRRFVFTWLKADVVKDLSKDEHLYPEFDDAAVADLRSSLDLFLEDVIWSEQSDFRQLLLADKVYLNERLAKLYDDTASVDGDFEAVRIDDGRRAGVLTHPYLMASFAHDRDSSPIHRGVFLARGVLGRSLRPPPIAVAPLAPDLHPGLTTRERVAMQTKPANCMTCHAVINQLGFTLEHYDAVGRFRDQDRGKPVDDAGSYLTESGATVKFDGARELAQFLAESQETHSAFTEQLFHHLVQQPVRAYGQDALEQLRTSFEKQGFHIRKLAVEVMAISALQARGMTEDVAQRE
jgi:cytochrome c553